MSTRRKTALDANGCEPDPAAAPYPKRVRCLGPRPTPHCFISGGPENRVCTGCRQAIANAHVSPRMADVYCVRTDGVSL